MRSAAFTSACAIVALLGWAGIINAQKAVPGTQPSPFTPNNYGCSGPIAGCGQTAAMRQFELFSQGRLHLDERLRQDKEWSKEFARKETEKLIKELSIPCELVDAERAGGGKVTVDGRMLDVKVYEAACRSGTGYFLVSQLPAKSLAISCFAADAARTGDPTQGVKPDEFTCQLSDHRDVKTMAASVLKGVGTSCDVKGYHWVGVSYVSGAEYSEVSCTDGQGYVLEVPKTADTQISAVGCQDAVKQGIKCTLTAVTMPVTLQTFRDAITEHAVTCEPEQIRYVGRETLGRRYVVELQCPQHPNGLVAFIPLEGNPKPFETVDCPAALKRAVQCKLTATP